MPFFDYEISSEPLTDEEIKWCKSVEKLLMKTPKRFGLATIGDADLLVFDRVACEERGVPQEEQEPARAGLVLAQINSSEGIQGWCG